MTSTGSDGGQRLRDMLQVFRARTPKLRPNVLPMAFRNVDLLGICSTAEQRAAVTRVVEAKEKEAVSQLESDELVLFTAVDVDAGTFSFTGAKFMGEVEADLYSVETILNLHAQGAHDELSIRMQHFLSVNGYDPSDLPAAQEIFCLAYAIAVCLSAAPLRGMIMGNTFPLGPNVDAADVVSSLFDTGAPSAGAGKKLAKKRDECCCCS